MWNDKTTPAPKFEVEEENGRVKYIENNKEEG